MTVTELISAFIAPPPGRAPTQSLKLGPQAQPMGAPASGALPSAKLYNLAGARRREWCKFALPYGVARNDKRCTAFMTDRGLFLRAVRGEDVGVHSTMWRAFTPFNPNQVVGGTVLEPGPADQDWAFAAHPWASDDLPALIPHVAVRHGGFDHYSPTTWPTLVLESESPAHQTWYATGRVGESGFVAHVWITFGHLSPIAEVEACVIWADPNNPAPVIDVGAVFFVTGEYVSFDAQARNGIAAPPLRVGNSWWHPIAGNARLQDGSGFATAGRMLCLPQKDFVPDEKWVDDVETLQAAFLAPCIGVGQAGTWDGRWLAHRNAPRVGERWWQSASDKLTQWLSDQALHDRWEPQPLGCAKRPGQTGNQEDFGATKGWQAVAACDGRWLQQSTFAALAEFYRGYMFHEADGTPLDLARHPQWTTWIMGTHWHVGQSPDRIGKRAAAYGEVESSCGGYMGYDDQHRSLNNAFACYALTGSRLLRFALERAAVAWRANVMVKNDLGSDAARAVGRRGLTYANLMVLFAPATPTWARANELQADMLRQFLRDWKGNLNTGVDVLEVATDPRLGITFQGKPVPAWSVWGSGILVGGAYALWKVTRSSGWLDVAKRVARTCVKYGAYRDAALGLVSCAAVAYIDQTWVDDRDFPPGAPLPTAWYGTTLTTFDGGLQEWAGTAAHAFVEMHGENDPDMARARELSAAIAPDQGDPNAAEWRAVVRSMPPVPGAFESYSTVPA